MQPQPVSSPSRPSTENVWTRRDRLKLLLAAVGIAAVITAVVMLIGWQWNQGAKGAGIRIERVDGVRCVVDHGRHGRVESVHDCDWSGR